MTSEKTPKNTDVAHAYREARRESGLSQERLAAEAGISRRQYIRIENGEFRPRRHTRALIAEALGVEPESLPAGVAMPPFQATSPATSRKRSRRS